MPIKIRNGHLKPAHPHIFSFSSPRGNVSASTFHRSAVHSSRIRAYERRFRYSLSPVFTYFSFAPRKIHFLTIPGGIAFYIFLFRARSGLCDFSAAAGARKAAERDAQARGRKPYECKGSSACACILCHQRLWKRRWRRAPAPSPLIPAENTRMLLVFRNSCNLRFRIPFRTLHWDGWNVGRCIYYC